MSGGFGVWEFVFLAMVTYCAYKGLGSYNFIGAGWLLHTGWDVLHHLYSNPIVPFVPDSSLGCAICDPVIALWCSPARRPCTTCFAGRDEETVPVATQQPGRISRHRLPVRGTGDRACPPRRRLLGRLPVPEGGQGRADPIRTGDPHPAFPDSLTTASFWIRSGQDVPGALELFP